MSKSTKISWPDCLGDTEEKIAESLRKAGIKGRRSSEQCCPIALSYKHTYPNGWDGLIANYSRRSKRVTLTFNDSQIIDPHATHQEALSDFMRNFDLGKYPELDLDPLPQPQSVENSEWQKSSYS